MLLWKLFPDALGRFLYQDLVRSSPAAAGPSMTILWVSLWGPGMTILVKVFYDSSWEALVQILVKSFLSSKRSLHDLVQVLVRRSCGCPVQINAVLAKRFWRCSVLVFVWKFFCDVRRSQEVLLWRSCEIPYTEGCSFAIFWNSLTCPRMRFWYEALMSRQRCLLRHNKFLLLQFRQCLTWSVTVP